MTISTHVDRWVADQDDLSLIVRQTSMFDESIGYSSESSLRRRDAHGLLAVVVMVMVIVVMVIVVMVMVIVVMVVVVMMVMLCLNGCGHAMMLMVRVSVSAASAVRHTLFVRITESPYTWCQAVLSLKPRIALP
jgi:hypothetical protein